MKILCFILTLFIVFAGECKSQIVATNDSLKNCMADSLSHDSISFSRKDSLYLDYLSDAVEYIAEYIVATQPRYKLYKTENMYNLIELDTATGKLWMVQYGMNNKPSRMKSAIDDTSLLWDSEPETPGRYELYPTANIHTFILLDTTNGRTYQVQWSMDSDNRFRIPIY